jgi:hypothetical protein
MAEHSRLRLWLHHAKIGASVIALGLAALGGVGIAHSFFARSMDAFWWTALVSVAGSLVPTGLVTVVYQWLMMTEREQNQEYIRSSFYSGVLVLPSHERAPSRRDVLMPARKCVSVLSTTMFQYFQVVGNLPAEKARQGVAFRFILYDPDSDGIAQKAREEGRDPEVFRHEIITTCEQHLGPLHRQFPESVQVRFCQSNTPFGITIIDDHEMILSLSIPGLSRVRRETPCLVIHNRYEPHSVFKLYERSFHALWDSLSDDIPASVGRFFNESDSA